MCEKQTDWSHCECRLSSDDNGSSMLEILDLSQGEKINRKAEKFEIVFVESGFLGLECKGYEDRIIPCAHLFLLPPGSVSTYTAPEGCCVIICRIDNEVDHCRYINIPDLHPQHPELEFDIAALAFKKPIKRFVQGLLVSTQEGLRCRPYLQAKYTELMIILQTYYDRQDLDALFRPMFCKNLEFRIFLFKHINECSSVKDLAERYHMSEGAFRRKFGREMGVSPRAFLINNRKTLVLHELKKESKSLKQIGEELGFKSQSELTRFCRKHLGDIPSNLRN